MFEIKKRELFGGGVIYKSDMADTLGGAVKDYIKSLDGNHAYLRGADLRNADLCGADLSYTDLRNANLCGADLSDADLSYANLSGADLRDANLCGANFGKGKRGTGLRPENLGLPHACPNLEKRVIEMALSGGALEMSRWHSCDTTHCLAGWAIHLSGVAGYALEAVTSPSCAGAILVPDLAHLFYEDNETVKAALIERLAEINESEVS